MDKYLKMSDVFCKSDAVETKVLVAFAVAVDYDDSVTPHEYAHHAIQYHDELVETNKELLSVLEALFHETSQQNLRKANDVITKIKGGSA